MSFWGPIPPCNIGSFTLPLEGPMILRETQFSTFSQTFIFGMLISTLTLCFFRRDTFRKLMVNVGKYIIHWLAGGFKHFFESSPLKLGKGSNLTRQHILQMGWFNHQLASLMWNTWDVNSLIESKYQTFTSLRCKRMLFSSHDHGSVENGCVSNMSFLSFLRAQFSTSTHDDGRKG